VATVFLDKQLFLITYMLHFIQLGFLIAQHAKVGICPCDV
jgi:hypothetical protein